VPKRVREQGLGTRWGRSIDHALAILATFDGGTPCPRRNHLSRQLGRSNRAVHALPASLELGKHRIAARDLQAAPTLALASSSRPGLLVERATEAVMAIQDQPSQPTTSNSTDA
jgi:hypothetical protein